MERLRQAMLGRRTSTDEQGLLEPMSLGSSLLGPDARNEADEVDYVGDDTGRSSSAGNSALQTQLQNNYEFTENLKREEEQIYNEIRARKILEEDDRKMALELARDYSDGPPPLQVQVTVPKGIRGGMFIKVKVSGRSGSDTVQVPPGLVEGDEFTYVTSGFANQRSEQPIPDHIHGNTAASRLTPEEIAAREEFLAALPEDMRNEILASEGVSQQAPSNITDEAQPPSGWVDMVQVEIPQGVLEGEDFQADMPDGRRIKVTVPPGFSAGDLLGIPAQASNEESENVADMPPHPPATAGLSLENLSPSERAEFLDALPAEIRDELLAAERNAGNHSQNVTPQEEDLLSSNNAIGEELGTISQNAPPVQVNDHPTAQPDDDLLGSFNDDANEVVQDLLTGSNSQATSSDTITAEKNASGFSFLESDSTTNNTDQGMDQIYETSETFSTIPDNSVAATDEIGQDLSTRSSDTTNVRDSSNDVIENVSSDTAATSVSLAAPSSLPPLERLKAARVQLDNNEITQEEFQAIKKKLIAEI